MANRYDIVRIDFQANARGANAAIESLRQEAEKSNAALTKTREEIDRALKANAPDDVIAGLRAMAKTEERRYKQLSQAQNELIKGMRVLDQGVKMFNDGSLNQMNAAFQKAVNSAATLAQSKLDAGTKEWREMGAIMQETQQNYARMQRDTDQLIQVIQHGGTVFRSTLEQEKKGIQELMGIVPYMGSEYQKLEGQLQVVTTKLDQMATAERQMKGEIVTSNDARRVAYQLTEEGAAAAKREAEAAEQTIAAGKERISVLEKERKTREDAARATAETVAKRNEDLAMQQNVIASIEKEIASEDRKSKKKREAADVAKQVAESSAQAVETEKAALEGLQATTKTAEEKVKQLQEELTKLGTQKVQPKVDTSGIENSTTATKDQTEKVKQQSKEQKTLKSDIDALTGTIKELKKQRDELTAAQKEGAKSTEGEAQSAQDLMAKMKSLNDEIEKQKKKLVKPEQDYQKELRFAATAKKPEDRDRLAAEAAQKLDEKTEKTRKKIQELSKQLDETRDAYKALTKEEESAANAAGSETEAVQKLTQARDRLKEMTAKSTFHESVSGERTITNPREAENYLLSLISANGGTVSKTQSSFPVSKFDNIRKAFGERYGMEKAEAEKWLKELISSPHGGIFTKAGGKDASGSYYLINNDVSKRLEFNKEKMQASKDLGATSLITDPAEIEKAYQAALKQLDVTEQQAAATEKLSEKTKQQTQATEKQVQTEQKQNEVEQQKATLTSQINALEEQKKQKQEQLRQLQQQSAEDERKKAEMQRQSAEEDKKKAELQKQLKDAQKELTNAQKEEEQQQKKLSDATAKANADKEKSIKMEEELANASADKTAELEKAKKTLGEMELATEKDIELNNQRQKELQETNDKIAAEGNTIREAEAKRAQSQTNSIKATEDAIRLLREENNTIEFNSEQWRKNAGEIQRLEAALGKMKGQATLQMMTDRMVQVDKLSSSALTETKRFWEAMVAGAENGSQELNTYKQNLEQVIAEEQSRTKKANVQQADKLLNGGYTTLSEEEIRKSIAAAREYQQTLQPTEETYKNLSAAILNAEDHLKKYGLEAERTSRKQKSLDALMSEQLQQGTNLSESALRTQEQYWRRLIDDPKTAAESIKGYQNELQRTIELQRQQAEITRNERAARLDGNLGSLSEAEIREAIEAGKQLAQSYRSTSTEAKEMAQKIVAAEEHIKQYGLEAQRAAQKQAAIDAQMRSRMSSLSTLSDSALAETKKYWEDMMRTQGLAEQKLSSYRIQLEKLVAEERRRKEVAAEKVVANMGEYSDEEIHKAVQAFEQLREAQVHGSDEWIYYNQRVQEGKKHLEEWAKMDSIVKMEEQMAKLPSLSDNALQETKKFWETMVAGAERGSTELRDYEAHLERVTKEEQERRQLANEMQAQKITGSNPLFFTMSESEIRKAIEATKQLQQTVEMGEDEYDQYTAAIIRAEDHLKRYGIEGTRTYEKLKETNRMYESQLLGSTQMSESALKVQESYWRKLIDDPHTASDELRGYESNLERVHQLQQQMVNDKGLEAYRFFANGEDADASANTIEEQVKNLKAYRDSLPKETHADTIRQINEYIQKTGEAAKVASGEMMRLEDAEVLAGKLGTRSFSASTTQLQQAKKALVEAQNAAGRGTPRFTELQSAINKVNLELAKTGNLSKEVQSVLDSPKGRSFNELKQAVEQGRAALQNMSRTTDEEKKDFDELAKKIKEADFEMRSLGNSSKGTASAFDKAWSRLKTYIGLYVGAAVAMQKLTATMGDLIELSDKMGEVRKTTGFTADEVGRLSENLKKMDTRTSITGLLELSVAAGQLGLKTQEDVQGFTEAANKLMVALPEMGKEGATEMMKVALATGEIDKIRKQMEEGLIDGSSATAVAMEKVGSTIDRLRATSAATAPAITDFVKRVGAVGAQSGISIDQVAALGSTVDALGMRVEMSATALSRMIPAIRNNSFDIAKVIGVTPDVIRNLFDAGRGMEVVLMILQHIKDSGMDADSIEGMLGMGNMKEIMKELNQMGARAGIVFSGLSQNVDELRRQLGVAAEAYEENIAIQREYDKMNETTAAKWARLKNQLEEMFVGDAPQRLLGSIIDGLRYIVDFISGNLNPVLNFVSGILKTMLVTWTAFKIGLGEGIFVKAAASMKSLGQSIARVTMYTKDYIVAKWALVTAHTAEEKAAAKAKLATVGLNKAMKANIIMAVVAAVGYLAIKLYETTKRSTQTGKAIADLEKEIRKETDAVDKLFYATGKTNNALQESKKRYEEVKKAGADTTEAEKQMQKASSAHASSIREINSTYGKYLGFMLSETSSAAQLAKARELINAKLRETITLKQREAALGNVEQEYGGETNRRMARLDDVIRQFTANRLDMNQQAKLSVDIAQAAQDYAQDNSKFQSEVSRLLKALNLNTKGSGGAGSAIMSAAKEYQQQLQKIANAEDLVDRRFNAQDTTNRKKTREATVTTLNQTLADWRDLLGKFQKAEGEEKGKLAAEVYKQQRAYANLLSTNSDYLANDKRKAQLEQNVKNMKTWEKSLRSVAGEAIRAIDAMERAETKGTDYTQGGESADNPWGTPLSAESLDYANMNAEELVRRRKQMAKFVNAIQTDTDVQSVLAEDKALKAAIEKGMSSDMRTVIEWYNTERLKIQDELKARHLTNEGNWLDPKKDRSGKTRTPASDGALAELERYYAWRKEMIEQARIEEGLTEEEFNRRIDVMEEEHMKKRSDLRVSFTTRDKKFIEQFHKWWASVEELEEIDWQIIKDEWRAIMADAKRGDKEVKTNNMKAQKDLAAMERIVVKRLNAIDDILSKERPYDSIARNLQDNLTKMGILFADFDAEIRQRIASGETDVSMNAADEVLNRTKRIAFLLKESERAYSITAEDLLSSMYSEGFSSWADEIAHDDRLKQALMAQLRTAYDAIQDAIKKEASIIKEPVEIQWNDTAVAGGKSQKQMFEGVLSQLGLQEEAIKRANSLIGAGNASENVALRLSVKQMEIRLNMQAQYYALMRKIGEERASQLQLAARQANIESEQLKTEAARLRAEGRTEDAEQKERQAAKKAAEAIQASKDRTHVLRSLDLSTTQEQKKLDEQRTSIANQLEEIQNNTYKSLKEWADLLYSSLQSIFEASHAGEAEYYNELAKLNLTGKGGPGAGTYVVIENEGTEDAAAHYEYLDERQALERQREIERENAMAEAWKKVWDDLNMKMSEQITDWVNASLQNASVDANTGALSMNTDAIGMLTGAVNGLAGAIAMQDSGGNADGHSEIDLDNPDTWPRAMRKRSGLSVEEDPFNNTGESAETSVFLNPDEAGSFTQFYEMAAEAAESSAQRQIASIEKVDVALDQHHRKQVQGAKDSDSKMASSNQSAFAKMTQAMNLYGIAYQAMSNENMSATQKFEMIAIQAAGQAAITSLTTSGIKMVGDTAVQTPSVLTRIMAELGPIAGPIAFASFTALLGGLMGIAMSKLTKSKSQIASVTGAGSAGAGRLSTGMLTYAAGNVNEFTDPSTLTPGRQYNVDAADGKTYRARYMGRNPRTHLTNGPEFHLSGEKGKEMIIDAGTTRQITMNDNEIWRAIQTLSTGGRMRRVMKRGRGVPAFADGNVEDFEEMLGGVDAGMVSGMSPEQMAALQASIDRQSDLLDRALTEGIKGVFNVYGPDGLVSSYDQGKKTLQRHGERR